MKVLLDECIPERFRGFLSAFEIHTVRYAGFRGIKNGELFRTAEAADYEVLITIDQGFPGQHNMSGRRIAVIV